MLKIINKAKKFKYMRDWREKCTALILEFLLAVVTLFSLPEALIQPLKYYFGENTAWVSIMANCISILLAGMIIGLSIYKFFFLQTRSEIERNFIREQKINQINKTVFDSLYKSNSSKLREIFRYTYGSVPEWNPIDYKENVLVYDVHEQIRSILISLEDVVINIDPERFSDKNVSVELVYCYPSDVDNTKCVSCIPLAPETVSIKHPWKLISSGDTSGDQQSILKHLTEKDSFYVLIDSCGTVFRNNKFDDIKPYQQDRITDHVKEPKEGEKTYFSKDIRDWERAKEGEPHGTALGTIINIRNDNPEEVFVKAILTINTYGTTIFEPYISRKQALPVDKFGLTCSDYENVFINTILTTYSRLLETELAQMYIRHSIRNGYRCRKTGRSLKKVESSDKDMLTNRETEMTCKGKCDKCNCCK